MDFKDKVVVITGKERVWAESFTDGAWNKVAQDDWSFDKLKPIADQYFHAGINAIILHVMISQPGDPSQPAVRPWFGTFFDRRSQHAADFWKKVWWKKGEGLIVIDLLPSSIYPSPFSERSEFNV